MPQEKIALEAALTHQPDEVRIAVLNLVALEQLAHANLDERVTSEIAPPLLFRLRRVFYRVFRVDREGTNRFISFFQRHIWAPPLDGRPLKPLGHFFEFSFKVVHCAPFSL